MVRGGSIGKENDVETPTSYPYLLSNRITDTRNSFYDKKSQVYMQRSGPLDLVRVRRPDSTSAALAPCC